MIYEYSYRGDKKRTRNKSKCWVEIVSEKTPEVVEVKFHRVFVDDSGNDYFTYLLKTGSTMNVSRKYLRKVSKIKLFIYKLINC